VVRRAAWTLWHLVTIELWGGSNCELERLFHERVMGLTDA